MFRAAAAMIVIAGACSGTAPDPKPDPVPAVLSDGGADAVPQAVAVAPTASPAPKRPTRPIEIILRSTPGDAEAWVDGAYIGITPQVWGGETGAPHTFMFKKAGYAVAQYRFVPVTTGILHPRLDPVAEDVDAGVPPPREVAPVELAPPPPMSVDATMAPLAPFDQP
ncbi:MAG: hypothetical protein ABI175_26725 [Polyangiales bacterium]